MAKPISKSVSACLHCMLALHACTACNSQSNVCLAAQRSTSIAVNSFAICQKGLGNLQLCPRLTSYHRLTAVLSVASRHWHGVRCASCSVEDDFNDGFACTTGRLAQLVL